jgi:restriction system protein
MAVPDYQSLMLPLLQFAARKGTEISTSEAVEALAKELGLTEDDLREMLPSGVQPTFVNRVGWAATYMKKAYEKGRAAGNNAQRILPNY